MTNLNQNKLSAAKTCSRCGDIKSIHEFSFRSTELRYESKCKVCRRALRKRNDNNKGHDFGAIQRQSQPQQKKPTPKRTIEPKVGMTNARLQAIDFDDLEKCSGRSLDHLEKHDAVQRFNEFVELLREGYSEIVGSYVHIRKD